MSETADRTALDQWYCLEALQDIGPGAMPNRLLGVDLTIARDEAGRIAVTAEGRPAPLPTRERYGYLWTTLGTPAADLSSIPEAFEADRRSVVCGAVSVRSSGPRIVENFLDLAHFPFVHTNILGVEPHTEVDHYTAEIRRDVDEVWATDCRFYQPQAALSAKDGIMTHYVYRVLNPFAVILYKTCPNAADRQDIICLFVQPLEEDRCRAHPVMFLIDDASPLADLIHFQQLIFLQDRIILENQRPLLLPLGPRAEMPARADATSATYRRWLKEKGLRYGTTLQAA
ncbi:aromatic ring-hydroxylating oxygenase subunit alpha [Telmatospirillum siberiense]|uniref:(2Fe-2S)-binding protein n=1 Tax=Telmatospirillum siberiense TaxID=382514 RepID=A0A2N3PYG8_9PROT|nr:aromatic ring-hydroxylating dioxygenase subunit alpha [Telmatospirillum siberiense]PKU25462.1 (2Fe-2S)-binding protein [Telmatospirillum siberiense]